MPTSDDINDHDTLSESSIYCPVSSDKSKLSWDGNDATILGLLHEVGRYYRRKGLFQPLLRDRAVALSNGRLAVEDPNTVYFVSGTIKETRGFDDPCPPTITRITEHNDEVGLGTRPGTAQTVLTSIPEAHKATIIVAPHSVEKEDSTFLHSLSYVFGNAEPSEALLEDADGSGLKLLDLLRERGKKANARDKALVTTKFTSVVRDGVKGELTLSSFAAFLKTYKASLRNIAPASRPAAEAEVEMINVIAMKDSASRELYELKTATTPPTDLDSAAKVLTDMLRGRVRCEEIDGIASGVTDLALSAAKPRVGTGRDAASVSTALAAAGINPASLKPAQLEALVTALAPPDPRLRDAGKGQDKRNIPRDKDGKPTKWVDGMALCRCGVNGGKHLFKDCPKKKERDEKAKKEKAAPAAALAAESKGATGAGTGPTEDQLRTLLSALFAGTVPTVELPATESGLTTGE